MYDTIELILVPLVLLAAVAYLAIWGRRTLSRWSAAARAGGSPCAGCGCGRAARGTEPPQREARPAEFVRIDRSQ